MHGTKKYKKFLGSLTKKGNKTAAKNIMDNSLISLAKKLKRRPNHLLNLVFYRLNCFLELKTIKKRRNTHLVPFPITHKRQNFLKIK